MITLLDSIREDCEILLNRAFAGKQLYMFGEDGNGQYGKRDFALFCDVICISVSATAEEDDHPSDVQGIVKIYLANYDASVHGHAITDQNLRFSLNELLSAQDIDPEALEWGDISIQENDGVTLSINVSLLMDWA